MMKGKKGYAKGGAAMKKKKGYAKGGAVKTGKGFARMMDRVKRPRPVGGAAKRPTAMARPKPKNTARPRPRPMRPRAR